jgi:fructokinase
MNAQKLFGSIEAGGTKFVCAIGSGPNAIQDKAVFPTESPAETFQQVINFFKASQTKYGKICSLGICSFGPVDIHKDSLTFGFITSTPKPGWENTDILGAIRSSFPIPVGFDTDVNGAALGESRWGAARGFDQVLYITVGTGIGGGALVNGRPVHGLLHPEMGHIRIPHSLIKDPYPGCCPYHGDCLEGLACGVALSDRWGKPGHELIGNEPVWDLEAEYLALGVVNFILVLSPHIVVLGGGIMQNDFLFPKIRKHVSELLNHYISVQPVLSNLEKYIVPPELGDMAGIAGGFVLAEEALSDSINVS